MKNTNLLLKKKNKRGVSKMRVLYMIVFFIASLFGASGAINYNQNGDIQFSVNENFSTFTGDVRNFDNVNAISQFSETNLNTGDKAIAAFTALNNNSLGLIIGITGGGYADDPNLLPDQVFMFSNANEDVAFGVGHPQGFEWRNDLAGRGLYEDTLNILMTLDSEGNLNVTGNLTVGGTLNDISAKVTKTTDQSIPNNVLTMVTWDSESYDTDNMHDTVINNSRITFNTAGKYSILAQSEWGINSGGFRFMDIMKNGVDSIARVRDLADNAAEHNLAFVGEFEVGDYIELQVFQDSGGNLDFESGTILENTYLTAYKIN